MLSCLSAFFSYPGLVLIIQLSKENDPFLDLLVSSLTMLKINQVYQVQHWLWSIKGVSAMVLVKAGNARSLFLTHSWCSDQCKCYGTLYRETLYSCCLYLLIVQCISVSFMAPFPCWAWTELQKSAHPSPSPSHSPKGQALSFSVSFISWDLIKLVLVIQITVQIIIEIIQTT